MGENVLVVDDSMSGRTVLVRGLVKRGFQPIEAANGEDALRMLVTQPVDIVLLDSMMPGMSGPEVLQAIRARWCPNCVSVLMVTASTDHDSVVHALKSGANGYLTKPVDMDVVQARIDEQISQRCVQRATPRYS